MKVKKLIEKNIAVMPEIFAEYVIQNLKTNYYTRDVNQLQKDVHKLLRYYELNYISDKTFYHYMYESGEFVNRLIVVK